MSPEDAAWFRRALRLARAGTGATYPNPCVGALVVKRGELVGSGRSARTGGPHAERRALERAGEAARGASVYVSLEPCAHQGRTGPCARALVRAGVARVVVGVVDPSPRVAGRGLKILRRAGIRVELVEGALAREAEEVHAHYLHHLRSRRPFVSLKLATSLDGQIASASGDSRWITSLPARRQGHRLRARHHAIAVGAATVLADDPRLDVRLVRGTDPEIVVFDPRLRCLREGLERGRELAVLRPGTRLLHGGRLRAADRDRLAALGVEPHRVGLRARLLDLDAALDLLGELELRSLLVEGGGRLVGAFVEAGSWQELHHFVAPILIGVGRPGLGAFAVPKVAEAPRLELLASRRLGVDRWDRYRPAAVGEPPREGRSSRGP